MPVGPLMAADEVEGWVIDYRETRRDLTSFWSSFSSSPPRSIPVHQFKLSFEDPDPKAPTTASPPPVSSAPAIAVTFEGDLDRSLAEDDKVKVRGRYIGKAIQADWIWNTEYDFLVAKKQCLIATAVYGSATAREVQLLAAFRDRYLLPTQLGQTLVAWYYTLAPAWIPYLEGHPRRQRFWRQVVFTPLVAAVAAFLRWREVARQAKGTEGGEVL
jgi:hypothetical protein